MLLDSLRQLESKNVITSKYNVYDTLVILKSKKSYHLNGIKKKDFLLPFKMQNQNIANKNSQLISFSSNNFKTKKVIFDRFDVSYLVKKLLLKKLTLNFLNLKLIAIRSLVLNKINAISGLKPSRRLRSRNLRYAKGSLIYVLGKSIFIPRTLLSYVNKKLPFKVFKAYLSIRFGIKFAFSLSANIRELKGFFLSNFSRILHSRLLIAGFVIPVFFKKFYKFLNLLSKIAFIKHKFEVMKRFSFFKYVLKKKSFFIFNSVNNIVQPYNLLYLLGQRGLNSDVLLELNRFSLNKLAILRKSNYIYLNFNLLKILYYKNFEFFFNSLDNLFRFIYLNYVLEKHISFMFSKYLFYALRRVWLKILKKGSLSFSFYGDHIFSHVMGEYTIFTFSNKLNKYAFGSRYVSRLGQNLANTKRIKQMGVVLHNFWKLYKFKGRTFIKILKKLKIVANRKGFTLYRINKYINPYMNLKFSVRRDGIKFSKSRRSNVINYKKIQNKNLFKKKFKYATIR